MKILFSCFILFTSVMLYAQNDNSRTMYNCRYSKPEVDTMPCYPGGSQEMFDFFVNNFRLNDNLRFCLQESFIYIPNFDVSEEGKISDIRFKESKFVYVENEITRILKIMPNWLPARKGGNTVSFRVFLPLNISANKSSITIYNVGILYVVAEKRKFSLLQSIIIFVIGSTIALSLFFLP